MAELRLAGVSKVYANGVRAVRDVNLDIADGELLVLVGPSGCGKSTLLRMIAGLEDITEGVVEIDGRVVNADTPRERDIAMVFQNYALYPHMTVRKNIGYSLRLGKVPKGEAARRIEDTAAMLELTDLLDRKPGALSGGQRQRVAMGRAIVRKPASFLMDEPLSNLDARLRVQMRAEIIRLQRNLGTTTVYVTHDQVEAMTMGTRVAVLRDGLLQQVDSPQVLYDHPGNVFVAAFIGSPSMNLYKGRIERTATTARVVFGAQSLPLPDQLTAGDEVSGRDGQEVIVGIRPEWLVEQTRDNADWPSVRVRVELVEALGSELVAHTTIEATAAEIDTPELAAASVVDSSDGAPCLARLSPGSRVAVGDTIDLAISTPSIHLFDAATERSLRSGPDR